MTKDSALKRLAGRSLLGFCEQVPAAKPFLKRWGLRTTPGWFANRVVQVQLPGTAGFKLASLAENYLSFELFWRGAAYYEPITTLVMQELLRDAATFLDVGANIGFYSLVASLCQPQLGVVAFEPNPKNFRLLQANVAANPAARILCEPLALSDREGRATLHLSASDMSASLESDFESVPGPTLEVARTTVDAYLAQHPKPGRLVMKVDVEGHEEPCLKGAEQTLAQRKPDLILEVTAPLPEARIACFKQAGYGFYQITDQGLLPAPKLSLVVRDRFLFLNYLLSARPAPEVAELFRRIAPRVRALDLTQTSKCVDPAMIHRLQARQPAAPAEVLAPS